MPDCGLKVAAHSATTKILPPARNRNVSKRRVFTKSSCEPYLGADARREHAGRTHVILILLPVQA
eukprot:6205170-Pleurochrysis_carterae.AAC.1